MSPRFGFGWITALNQTQDLGYNLYLNQCSQWQLIVSTQYCMSEAELKYEVSSVGAIYNACK